MAAPTTGLFHGVQGNAVITTNKSFATYCINVTKWELTWPNDYFRSDIFGAASKGVKHFRGMYDVSGSFEGFCPGVAIPKDTGDTGVAFPMDPGALPTAVLTLTERTNVTYAGAAHVNLKISVNRQTGLNVYTATFKGHGDWTETAT